MRIINSINDYNNQYYNNTYNNRIENYKVHKFAKHGTLRISKVRKTVFLGCPNSYFEGVESDGGCHELR